MSITINSYSAVPSSILTVVSGRAYVRFLDLGRSPDPDELISLARSLRAKNLWSLVSVTSNEADIEYIVDSSGSPSPSLFPLRGQLVIRGVSEDLLKLVDLCISL